MTVAPCVPLQGPEAPTSRVDMHRTSSAVRETQTERPARAHHQQWAEQTGCGVSPAPAGRT